MVSTSATSSTVELVESVLEGLLAHVLDELGRLEALERDEAVAVARVAAGQREAEQETWPLFGGNDKGDTMTTTRLLVLEQAGQGPEQLRNEDCLVQPRVLEQINNGSCGYYALHNAHVCMRASRLADVALRDRVLQLLDNRTSFWRFFARCINVVLREATRHDNRTKWPWATRCIRDGILERTYLPVVLAHVLADVPAGGGVRCHYVHYAYKHFANTMQQLNDLHCAFQRSSSGAGKGCEVFMVGVLSHWVVLFVHTPTAGSRREIVYMDSYNRTVLQRDDTANNAEADADAYVADVVRERTVACKPVLESWRREVIRQSRIDAIHCVQDLLVCLRGQDDVRRMALTSMVERMMASYYAETTAAAAAAVSVGLVVACTADLTVYTARLVNWLENFYHPMVLRKNFLHELREHGFHLVREDVVVRLHAWCDLHHHAQQLLVVQQQQRQLHTLVIHFFAVVSDLKVLLHNSI